MRTSFAGTNATTTATSRPRSSCADRRRDNRHATCESARVRVRDLNWMQLEAYLRGDDRIVLPVGSTEQHAYLSLETDNILAERASVEAAEPLGVPVLPVLPFGLTGFTAYPGSPTLLESTLVSVLSDIVDSLVG